MSDRAGEQPPPRLAPLAIDDDEGVSPVIGMILVLAISIVGIAAILYWGLPAIDSMKANVEYRSVQTQFSELDSTLRELVAGTTEKTAKRWQPALDRGSINVQNDTEPWLFATEMYNASSPLSSFTNFSWGNLKDGDATFTLVNHGRDLPLVKVEAFIVTGTSSLTTLNVSLTPTPLGHTAGNQMDGTWLPLWSNNTWQNFTVYVANSNPPQLQPLDGYTFKFRIWTGTTLLSEAWYVNTSRIDYTLHSSMSDMYVGENNGAIVTGASGSYTIFNSPPIPPVTNTSGVPRFFGRALALQGNASFAGSNRFDLLITLYSTVTLESLDCSKNDSSDCVVSSKIYDWGAYNAPWNAYLNSTGLGYNFHLWPDTITPNGVYLEDREWKMAYTLLESNVRVSQ
jgi:hypothetical protein